MQAKRYAPVGRCIYCGSRVWSTEQERKLGDEHIVAEGLGGNLVLPESSCKSCEEETSRFELVWLRSFDAVRVEKGLRKKKRRSPRVLVLTLQRNGQSVRKHIPAEQYPPMIVTLKFNPPEILSDSEQVEKEFSGGVATAILPSFVRRLKQYLYQGWSVTVPPAQRDATARQLGRMLAKIAHSYAVAELGLGGFQPFLQPIILGTDTRYLAYYVGGSREIPVATPELYKVQLARVQSPKGRQYLRTDIRLLSSMQGMPQYQVVVGQPSG